MSETPGDRDGAPSQDDVERAAELERADVDPGEEPNAPRREPTAELVGPRDPDEHPGPIEPGENDPDRPGGIESFERPGRDGNWDDSDLED